MKDDGSILVALPKRSRNIRKISMSHQPGALKACSTDKEDDKNEDVDEEEIETQNRPRKTMENGEGDSP